MSVQMDTMWTLIRLFYAFDRNLFNTQSIRRAEILCNQFGNTPQTNLIHVVDGHMTF